ncbi:MFS transporter, partial [Pseudoalteromonas sp. S1941]
HDALSLSLLVLPWVWLWVKVPAFRLPPQTQSLPISWMNRTFLLCCTLALVEIIVLYGLTIHLPFYLSAQQASASTIGLVIAGFLFAMSCVSMGYGRV